MHAVRVVMAYTVPMDRAVGLNGALYLATFRRLAGLHQRLLPPLRALHCQGSSSQEQSRAGPSSPFVAAIRGNALLRSSNNAPNVPAGSTPGDEVVPRRAR